jgi:hypothetical protein
LCRNKFPVDAVLAPGLVVCDGPSVGVKLFSFNHRLLKHRATKRQIQLARMSFDADTPALGSFVQDHPAGVIPQRSH